MARLTRPLLEAMESALNAALAGGGFDGGDFTGQNPAHFERALRWVEDELKRHKRRHPTTPERSEE